MRTDWIVKLNFLLLGFGLTSYFIYQVNTKGLSPNLLSILGIKSAFRVGTLQNADDKQKAKISWCETRVTGILLPNNMRLVQEGAQWIQESSGPKGETRRRTVDFIAAEKWLAKYCSLSADQSMTANATTVEVTGTPAMIIKYVNGQVGVLKKTSGGELLWKGQQFRSAALDAALNELVNLPAARSKE